VDQQDQLDLTETPDQKELWENKDDEKTNKQEKTKMRKRHAKMNEKKNKRQKTRRQQPTR